MTDREIAELKRTFKPERATASELYGCYVNANGDIISTYRQSLGLLGDEECESYFSLFKKTLSGAQNRNLYSVPFATAEVEKGEKHGLLMKLRSTNLSDEEARGELYRKITSSYKSEENYVILAISCHYDVVKKDRNNEGGESAFTHSFIVVTVCPVKSTKTALAYDADDKKFKAFPAAHAINAPEVGFTFPAFDNRETNIYNALFFTKNTAETYHDLTENLFNFTIAMAAKTQKDVFDTVLAEALDDDCSFRVMRAVHQTVSDKIDAHKEAKIPEPLLMGKAEVKDILEEVGIPEEKLEKFTEKFAENFGANTELSPKNLVNPKKFELKTANVKVSVEHGYENLVETKIINGKPYIVISAEGGVELNGIDVKITD
ncbi:MAG: DUF4317 domain-containing protein [Clostridia bacterium]|nr:DUF4317 domain-containing protein [Clostridia bacterium]